MAISGYKVGYYQLADFINEWNGSEPTYLRYKIRQLSDG